jgi:hypothetical protein
MESEDDRKLWADVVAAETQLVRARFQFNQRAQSRKETLREALTGASKPDRHSAISFLQVFSEDVPYLLDQLFEISLSPGWALEARKAIARGPAKAVTPALHQLLERRLADPQTDADDYQRIAELLDHLHDTTGLATLVQTASRSPDPEIREVGTAYDTPS